MNEMTAHAPKTQWVWNLEEADIDDPTGEIRRLGKQVNDVIAISSILNIDKGFMASFKSRALHVSHSIS